MDKVHLFCECGGFQEQEPYIAIQPDQCEKHRGYVELPDNDAYVIVGKSFHHSTMFFILVRMICNVWFLILKLSLRSANVFCL